VNRLPAGAGPGSLLVAAERRRELRSLAESAPSWDLTPRQICDLELLLNGAFAPLSGFLNREDFQNVCDRLRLADGALWPMPITLDVTEAVASALRPGDPLVLRDPEGVPLAILWMEEAWRIDREAKAQAVFGTLDRRHPGVDHLYTRSNDWAVGGRLEGLDSPRHYDFVELRRTPAEMRAEFARRGWQRVVAFQTRNPLHRAHHALTLRAARELGAGLLLHPVVGMTKPGDVDHYTRVRCYSAALRHYPENSALLALLPLAMRMGGPREALWHGIIRRNFGCTHIIVGRDHAGPGKDSQGRPFYGPYEAQELFRQHEEELGIRSVPFREMAYVAERGEYMTEDEVPRGATVLSLSGTELRSRLQRGAEIPEWFTFPEVAAELRRTHPPRHQQGFTVFFTGLSGAGKSTLANALRVKLLERGGRPVTLLDGDLVRKHLSSELGFSREHRDLNIRRIAFVAAEITKTGGIALCAPIAPYEATRRDVRESIEAVGGFLLVHVSTPIDVCEGRDRKGLYAKARAGTLPHFTGISDPYETPTDADLAIDTTELDVEAAVQRLLDLLVEQGFVGSGEEPVRV
jgi:sulfate adenylyltransferase